MALNVTLKPAAATPASASLQSATPAPAPVADTTATDAASAEVSPEAAQQEEQLFQTLSSNPDIQAIASGQLPAAFAPLSALGEGAENLGQYLDSVLPQIGPLKRYFAPSSDALVVYNEGQITEQQLAEADAAGQIQTLAQPFQSLGGEGGAPAGGGSLPAVPAGPAPATPQSLAAGLVAPPGVAPARSANLSPPPPARQARPGAGQIANDLIRRAV